jgi:hypothetical protein
VLMSLHKRARTIPAIRQEIAASNDQVSVLAQRYNVTIATIYKWRSPDSFKDLSHTAHTLQTTLTPHTQHSHEPGAHDCAAEGQIGPTSAIWKGDGSLIVARQGLEPRTCGLLFRRSNQLS